MSESGAGQGSPRGSRAGLVQADLAFPPLPQTRGAGKWARGTAALWAAPPVQPCPQESGPHAGRPGCPHRAASHSSACTLAVGSQGAALLGLPGASIAPASGAGNLYVCRDKEALKDLTLHQIAFLSHTIIPSKKMTWQTALRSEFLFSCNLIWLSKHYPLDQVMQELASSW